MNSKQILLILSLTLAIFLIPKPTHAAITTFQILAPINGEQTLNTTLPLKLFLISTNATYITCNLSLYRWDGTFLYNMTLNITNATVYSDNLSLSPDDYYFYLTCNDTNSSFTTKGPIKIGFGNTIYQWGMILEDPGQYKLGRDIFVPTKLAQDTLFTYHGVLVYPLNQTYVKLMSHVWYNGKPYNYTIYPVFPIHYMFDPYFVSGYVVDQGFTFPPGNWPRWSFLASGHLWPGESLSPGLLHLSPPMSMGNVGLATSLSPTPQYILTPTIVGGQYSTSYYTVPYIYGTNKGIIMKSNEQLDCQGYEIYSNHKFYTGDYGTFNSSIGIDIEGNNVSIQNCIFKNIYHAIIDYNDTKTYTVNYTINIPQLSKKFPFLPLKMTLPYRLVNISLSNIQLYNSSIVNPYGIINATNIYADHSYIFNLNKVNNSVFIDSEIATAAFPFAIYQNSNFTGTNVDNYNSLFTIAYTARDETDIASPMGVIPHYPTMYLLNDLLNDSSIKGARMVGTNNINRISFLPNILVAFSKITNSSVINTPSTLYQDQITDIHPCQVLDAFLLNSHITDSCIFGPLANNSIFVNTHILTPWYVVNSKLYNSNIENASLFITRYTSAASTAPWSVANILLNGYDFMLGGFIDHYIEPVPLYNFIYPSTSSAAIFDTPDVLYDYQTGEQFIANRQEIHLINGSSVNVVVTDVPVVTVDAWPSKVLIESINFTTGNPYYSYNGTYLALTNATYRPTNFGKIENNYFYINDSDYLPAISTSTSSRSTYATGTNYVSTLLMGNSSLYGNNLTIADVDYFYNYVLGRGEIEGIYTKEIQNKIILVKNNKFTIDLIYDKYYLTPLEKTYYFTAYYDISTNSWKKTATEIKINPNTYHQCVIFNNDYLGFLTNEYYLTHDNINTTVSVHELDRLILGIPLDTLVNMTNDMINKLYINPHNPKDYSVNVLIANNQINATNVKYGLCYYLDAGTYTTHNSIYGPDYAVLLNMTYPEYFTYNIFDAKDKDIYIDKNQYDINKSMVISFVIAPGPPVLSTITYPSYQINQWNITTYGNYYLLLNGKGYSQICTDNNHDKRCDQKYVILDPPTIVNIDYYPLWWPHQTLYNIGVPGPGPLIQLTNTSTHPKANLIVKPTELYFYIPNATECQTKTINIEWLGNTQGQISIGKDIQGEYLIWEPTDTFSQLVQPNTLIKLNIQVCSPTNYNTYPKETNATLFIYGTYQSGTLTKKVIIHLIKSKQPHHKKKKPITVPSPIPTSASWFNKLITYTLWIILIFAALLLIKAIAHKHAAHKLAYY